jgi:hypothetical protein
MMGNLVYMWIEGFVKGMGGSEEDIEVMNSLLVKSATSPNISNEVELLASPEHAMTVSRML